jgi:hypothetical protein
MATVGEVQRSIQRFDDFAEDLMRSDMNTFENSLGYLIIFSQRKAFFPECFEEKILHSG